MSKMIKIESRAVKIEAVGTHNTIQPFSSQMKKGLESHLWVHEIRGESPHPRIYVGGGTHGDELNGVLAVLKLRKVIPEYGLKGTIVLVPQQNPAAFAFRERLNPFDPIDPDWVHPGRVNGTYSERIKHVLTMLAANAECVIDLHTSGRGGANNPMIYVPPETGNGAGKHSLQLAKSFGGDRLVFGENEGEYGWPVRNAMPFVAVREGRLGLYAEAGIGGAGIPDLGHVNYFMRGVLNVMKSLDIIEGEVEGQGERIVVSPVKKEIHVDSPIDGLFIPIASLGSRVTNSSSLAEIWTLDGSVENVYSVGDGLITYMNQYGSVGSGDRLYTISRANE